MNAGRSSSTSETSSGRITLVTYFGGSSDIWDTITNFKAGDDLTIWDVTPGVVANWVNGMGAAGYQGATATMTDAFNAHAAQPAQRSSSGFQARASGHRKVGR